MYLHKYMLETYEPQPKSPFVYLAKPTTMFECIWELLIMQYSVIDLITVETTPH